jgi:ABC-type dipeptide/oligopeptide/nickel transport system permease component
MMPRESSPESIEAFRKAMGYDRPVHIQFWSFMTSGLSRGFRKFSYFKTPAMPLVLERLPATMELAGMGLLMAVVIAIPLGLVAGRLPAVSGICWRVCWACSVNPSRTSGWRC